MSTSAQAATGTPKVEISSLHKLFGELHVLRGIDLIVPPGSVTVLIGLPSSGKSTLLRYISEPESTGASRIKVDGDLIGMREVERRGRVEPHALSGKTRVAQRTKIEMIFRRFSPFSHVTALQNVMEASTLIKKTPKAKVRERNIELLERVELGDRLDHYPSQLSGSQQQRVATTWALTMDPELMLFDEPTSALDPELVGEMLQMMKDLVAPDMTMATVTHEMGFARKVGDQLIFMGGGMVVERGILSEVLDWPANERIRAFLSSVL